MLFLNRNQNRFLNSGSFGRIFADSSDEDSSDEEEDPFFWSAPKTPPYPFYSFTGHAPLINPSKVDHSDKVAVSAIQFTVTPEIFNL